MGTDKYTVGSKVHLENLARNLGRLARAEGNPGLPTSYNRMSGPVPAPKEEKVEDGESIHEHKRSKPSVDMYEKRIKELESKFFQLKRALPEAEDKLEMGLQERLPRFRLQGDPCQV